MQMHTKFTADKCKMRCITNTITDLLLPARLLFCYSYQTVLDQEKTKFLPAHESSPVFNGLYLES